MKSFLKLCNIHWHLVPNFAGIAAQLNKKLKKGDLKTVDNLTQQDHYALPTLQKCLVSALVLASPCRRGDLPLKRMRTVSKVVLVDARETARNVNSSTGQGR